MRNRDKDEKNYLIMIFIISLIILIFGFIVNSLVIELLGGGIFGWNTASIIEWRKNRIKQ